MEGFWAYTATTIKDSFCTFQAKIFFGKITWEFGTANRLASEMINMQKNWGWCLPGFLILPFIRPLKSPYKMNDNINILPAYTVSKMNNSWMCFDSAKYVLRKIKEQILLIYSFSPCANENVQESWQQRKICWWMRDLRVQQRIGQNYGRDYSSIMCFS